MPMITLKAIQIRLEEVPVSAGSVADWRRSVGYSVGIIEVRRFSTISSCHSEAVNSPLIGADQRNCIIGGGGRAISKVQFGIVSAALISRLYFDVLPTIKNQRLHHLVLQQSHLEVVDCQLEKEDF